MYDEEELEEERRLCYVAMTRAREKLVMTNARQRMLYGRTSANKSSRFWTRSRQRICAGRASRNRNSAPMTRTASAAAAWGDDFGGGSLAAVLTAEARAVPAVMSAAASIPTRAPNPRPRPSAPAAGGSTPAAPSVGLIQLSQGDQVEHTAFGKGTVVSVKPMGGDALAEVAFEGGTKKLMLKAAGKHLKKL